MPLYRKTNGSEIAPCVVSKARFALNKRNTRPTNQKKCSEDYWKEAVEVVAEYYEITSKRQIIIAKNKFFELING